MIVDKVATRIDLEKCIGCGLCVSICPLDTLSLKDGKAVITGTESLLCGHCAAICPQSAIVVDGLDPTLRCETFDEQTEWMPFGQPDIQKLLQLMRSRRSCRKYADKPVPYNILKDLVKIGISAPSGSNVQGWSFSILPNRETILELGMQVVKFFKNLNRMAELYPLRMYSYFFGKDELGQYYRNYYSRVKEHIDAFQKNGIDRLFHGAPAAILIGGNPKNGGTPQEDALLATQNILLAAHAMGLGTCLIGFVVEAMRRDSSIKKHIGISVDDDIYAVIAIGYPQEKYKTLTGRKPVNIHYFNAKEK